MIAIIRTALLLLAGVTCVNAQPHNNTIHRRERLLFDNNWRFSFGHPYDIQKDFDHGTGYFSYLAKAGYGDGAADAAFDDRAWRIVNLPHDWAVEQDFSAKGSFSHGFKQVGRAFPDKSIGWYRKTFTIPAADTGRRITIAFDGVFRNAAVWMNGHYLGTEPSGYTSFQYDITDYLNYSGENVLAVRADATMEEGWFYEGAGIYRHVWLQKTAPLHIATNGVVVTTTVTGKTAQVQAGITVQNDALAHKSAVIIATLFDPAGKQVAVQQQALPATPALAAGTAMLKLFVPDAQLWDIATPRLYKLVTIVVSDNKEVDRYETRLGIRTIRFDARTGFFLNGKHVTLKGTNNHQDHAGVGTAIPDALTEFRIKTLQEMGANAYRCSHHPPAPELLDACDRLGMLVIDETRLMGTTGQPLRELQQMILRDRNHPSVIGWSVGNEEWRIENNTTGARIAITLQAYAKSLDSTRPTTAGISGGFVSGISDVLEIMGYNYMGNGDIEAHHRRFPDQPAMGTEEGSTFATRGIYVTDSARHYIAAYDKKPRPSFYSIEEGWRFYDSRPYLAGLFIWTGFDYRGEPTPFGWPSVTSYFGMMDLCGFPKDNFYYLRSWWQDKPVLHLLPHWNWPGKEGKEIEVWAYSNCEEVELLLNGKNLGKKRMEKNGHLEWKVLYEPGVLEAIGYKNGQQLLTEKVSTAQQATAIAMQPHKPTLQANGQDVAVITVTAKDAGGRTVPVADNELNFTISGSGKIIGIGNGNPTSLEKEKYIDDIINLPIAQTERKDDIKQQSFEYTGHFELPAYSSDAVITFFYKSIGAAQTIYVNGKEIAAGVALHAKGDVFVLDKQWVHPGNNTVVIKGKPIASIHDWDVINTQPGVIQVMQKAGVWKRKLFNGTAQLIIQATDAPGEIKLTATGNGLANEVLSIPVL